MLTGISVLLPGISSFFCRGILLTAQRLTEVEPMVRLVTYPIRFYLVNQVGKYVSIATAIILVILFSASEFTPLAYLGVGVICLLGAPQLIAAAMALFPQKIKFIYWCWRKKLLVEQLYAQLPGNPFACGLFSSAAVVADIEDGLGNFQRSEELRRLALESSKRVLMPDPGDTMVCETLLLKNLAIDKNYDAVEESIERILQFAGAHLVERPSQIASSLSMVALVRCEQGKQELAFQAGELAVSALRAASLGEAPVLLSKQLEALFQALRALGTISKSFGRVEDAASYFDRVLRLRLNELVKNDRSSLVDFYSERISNQLWREDIVNAREWINQDLDRTLASSLTPTVLENCRFNRCHLALLEGTLAGADAEFFIDMCNKPVSWMPRSNCLEKSILLCQFYKNGGDIEKAKAAHARALACVTEAGLTDNDWLAKISRHCGEL